jgi:hypothetical protein
VLRRFAVLVLLAGIALPAFPAKRVTVEQLEQVLNATQGKRDGNVAHQLADLELSERLSPARFSGLEAHLPGARSKRALVLLSDLSAFLDPPPAEILAKAEPDLDAQRQLISLCVGYIGMTIRKLPNFFATRDTELFEDTAEGRRADSSLIPYQPIHAVSKSSATVLYRDGREVVDSGMGTGKRKRYEPATRTLITRGVFGPILGIVVVDAAHGNLSWKNWEQGAAGPEAVFWYSVPKDKSHYEVEFCCFPENSGMNRDFKKISAYHGEIAMDPADGSILRLSVIADLEPADQVVKSNILVDYEPVEIGARNYICPVKSVSIWVAKIPDSKALQTMLNDVVFAQYHLFRSESRVLTGNDGDATVHPDMIHLDPGSSAVEEKVGIP